MIAVGIDTETPGTEEGCPILGLGAYYDQGLGVTQTFSEYIRPDDGNAGNLTAISIHGLTPKRLALEGRPVGQVASAFSSFLPHAGEFFFVAHNAPFDRDKVDAMVGRLNTDGVDAFWAKLVSKANAPWVDTLRLAKKVLTDEESERIGGHKLDALWLWSQVDVLGGELDGTLQVLSQMRVQHDAFTDAKMALDLWDALKVRVPDTVRKIEDLVAWIAEPMLLEIITFSKEKGNAFADRPGWCEWLLKQEWAKTERPDEYYSAQVALGRVKHHA